METVLAKGLKENYFIGLDQMMPSLAKLKTAEDVQLAYAEVSSMSNIWSNKKETKSSRRLWKTCAIIFP